ncbi:MAG: undecaprenyl-diphosphate phosphatase [Candidatus Omnitrophica bacterium]|nr:undecaprenyl-diphosphate phosphatase [Candidatus Omnitrophota bacterium]
MGILKTIFLGFIQGVTEFLPISSSGHLSLMDRIFPGGDADVLFFTITHLGTMLATFVVFRKEISNILVSFKDLLPNMKKGELVSSQSMMFYIIIGSVPTGLAGIILADKFEAFIENINFVGVMFMVTGLILLTTRFAQEGSKREGSFGPWRSFLVGCAQGFAILPGISRSGTTISSILLLKGERAFAGRLSFLMSLPAILAANLLEFRHVIKQGAGNCISFSHILGFVVSFIVGFFSLKLLLRLVEQGKFHYFAYYCFAIGLYSLFVVS